MPTTVTDAPVVSCLRTCGPHEPTAPQWRAVRQALEKFLGVGDFAHLPKRTIRSFEFRWDDPEMLPNAAGVMATFFDGGHIVVAIRSVRPDGCPISADDIHRTMLHELQHVQDVELIDHVSRSYMEARANVTAECLSRVW
jgi:hypothetical protein